MPYYDFTCGHTRKFSFAEYDLCNDRAGFEPCPTCGVDSNPISANVATLYGLTRYADKAFADASEATGEKITSTKQIDHLEKTGVIRAITNPSTYKFKNGRNLRKAKLNEYL